MELQKFYIVIYQLQKKSTYQHTSKKYVMLQKKLEKKYYNAKVHSLRGHHQHMKFGRIELQFLKS